MGRLSKRLCYSYNLVYSVTSEIIIITGLILVLKIVKLPYFWNYITLKIQSCYCWAMVFALKWS